MVLGNLNKLGIRREGRKEEGGGKREDRNEDKRRRTARK